MKDKPIRSILDQSFNYALQDIVEPNAVSMIPKQHLDQAEQAIKDLIDQEVKKAQISILKEILDITSKPLGTDFATHETDLISGELVKHKLAELEGEK